MKKIPKHRDAHFPEHWSTYLCKRYQAYKARIVKKGKEFKLSDDLFEHLIYSNCFYCGISYKNTTMSIDRIDSNLGYIPTNVVSCCKICNTMKFDLNTDIFYDQIIKIVKHNNLKV